MDSKHKRSWEETVVRVLSSAYYAPAVILFITGVVTLINNSWAQEYLYRFSWYIKNPVLSIFFAFMYAVAARGLWLFKNWARYTVLTLAVLRLLYFPIGTLEGVVGIVFFGFNKKVKSLFR